VSLNQKYVYMVFSCTSTKIGAMIRFVTNNKYNHVSIALEDDLKKMYSFTRYRANAPFLAGFSEESPLRYLDDNTDVKICRIPVSLEKYSEVLDYIDNLSRNSKRYIYNYFSAFLFPAGVKIRIPDAYTCLEFGIHILSRHGLVEGICERKFYKIVDLEKLLEPFVAYEGNIANIAVSSGWGNDIYPDRMTSKLRICTGSAMQVGRLFYRLVRV
jgi:hypothetical protein